MSSIAIWIAATFTAVSQGLNVKTAAMSTFWDFHVNAGTFALPATRKEWSNTGSGS
jgi:hypothetical protein